MKYVSTIVLILISIQFFNSQIGINTIYPSGILHIDGAKDNVNLSPTPNQQFNDVVIDTAGNLGLGTISPTNKVEIVSSALGISGLKFTQVNNLSPLTDSDNILGLGVDASGNVVTTARPFFASVNSTSINAGSLFLGTSSLNTFFIPATAPGNYNSPSTVKAPLNATGSTIIDSFTINVPTNGRGVMINYMAGIDSFGYPTLSEGGNCTTMPCNNNPTPIDVLQARLFIDGVAQNVYQNIQMNKGNGGGTTDSNLQFNFSTLQNLSPGSHSIDVRISKVSTFTSTTDGKIRLQILSTSINATFIK